jgi:hypothetical protein
MQLTIEKYTQMVAPLDVRASIWPTRPSDA